MQAPDPEHVFFITKWMQEVILGFIVILLWMVKLLGSKFGGEKKNYVTISQLEDCGNNVGRKIDRLETKLDDYVMMINQRIDSIKAQ